MFLNQAAFLFYKELNDFLPPQRQGKPILVSFNDNQSVKHLVESLGVPHTEISRIIVNGSDVGFSYLVANNDTIQVFPWPKGRYEGYELLNSPPPGDLRFILDNHLGKLATYLRVLGVDTLYENYYQDKELAEISHCENRILLTRDRALLKRAMVRYGYCIRNLLPQKQIIEVIQRFDLQRSIQPFHRCLRCNHPLQPVGKEQIIDRLEPLTRQFFNEFFICPACDKIYWQGSHYEHMLGLLEKFQSSFQQEKDNNQFHE